MVILKRAIALMVMFKTFIQQKNYYWNSGIFYFQAKTILSEMQQLSPSIYQAAVNTYQTSEKNEHYIRLDRATFETCPNNSIDYEIMEKTDRAAMVPLGSPWNDFGCWASVAEATAGDAEGNVKIGNVLIQNSEHCYI